MILKVIQCYIGGQNWGVAISKGNTIYWRTQKHFEFMDEKYKKWGEEKILIYNLYDVTDKEEMLRCNQLHTLREWKVKKIILHVSYS